MSHYGPANVHKIAVIHHNNHNNVVRPPPPPYTVTTAPTPHLQKESPAKPGPEVTKNGFVGSLHGSSAIISFPEVTKSTDTLVENTVFSDQAVKLGFIRRVYSITLLQLLISLFIVLGFTKDYRIAVYSYYHIWVLIGPPIGLYFLTFICMMFCDDLRRRAPCNYIFLGSFTMSITLLVAFIGPASEYLEAFFIIGVTFAVVLALLLFTFQSKLSLTNVTGISVSVCVALICLGIALLLTPYSRMRLAFITLMIIVIGIYMVCDIQIIVRGYHRYNILPEEYIFAGLALHIDFIYLIQMLIVRMFRLLFL